MEDDEEVFGAEGLPPLHLQAWGADPRIKDSFVELDYVNTHPSNPLTETFVRSVADRYNPSTLPPGVPWDAVSNALHHGGNGIRMHFDIGASCTDKTLCGDWGGTNATTSKDADVHYANPADFDPARKTRFRYVVVDTTFGGDAGLGDHFGMGSATDDLVLTHEYGHNLGLEHYGHAEWGGLNCKPHYNSLMNYAGGWLTFSYGANPEVLDPSSMIENGTYSAYPVHDPLPYLQRPAHYNFSWDSGTRSVDWNFDGLTQSFSVRANPRQVDSWEGECQENDLNGTLLHDWTNSRTAFGKDMRLVRVGRRMYAFWRTALDELYYAYAATPGPNAYGSCNTPGAQVFQGQVAANTPCLNWTAPIYLTQGVLGSDPIS